MTKGHATSNRCDVVVIGAGASGLACAIAAARAGRQVVVLEAGREPGRTIRVTGDGRCNIANARTDASVYRNAAFVARAFEACPPAQSLDFLRSTGIVMREEGQGRLYPQANKAASVVDALLWAARRAGVRFLCDHRAVRLTPQQNAWRVECAHGPALVARAVAICVGGGLPSGLVPSRVPTVPASPVLGPLACAKAPRQWDKLRAKCALSCGSFREEGEVTFRTYGVSGIAAFNLSRIARPGDELAIDFLPSLAPADTAAFLAARLEALAPCTWEEFCCGMLLPLIGRELVARAGLDARAAAAPAGLPAFGRMLRAFPLTVTGIGDASRCQVHRGGIDVAALDPATMRVAAPGRLFACGEALDVDGPCGGFNLHWAWTSGLLAGKAVAKR